MKADVLIRLSAKGYGWYLALKICKAFLAIPLYPIYVLAWAAVAALLGLWLAIKGVFWDFPRMMTGTMMEYWEKPWFRNFGRAWYHRRYVWKPWLQSAHESQPRAGGQDEAT